MCVVLWYGVGGSAVGFPTGVCSGGLEGAAGSMVARKEASNNRMVVNVLESRTWCGTTLELRLITARRAAVCQMLWREGIVAAVGRGNGAYGGR